MEPSRFKVGDRVKFLRIMPIGPIDQGDVVTVTEYRSASGGQIKTAEHSVGWMHHSHFELVERKESTPQPHLFEDYAAASVTKAIEVTDGPVRGIVAISTEYQGHNSEPLPSSRIERNIYMSITNEEGQVVLSIEEAKEVAVALFDQILYHEYLKTQENL